MSKVEIVNYHGWQVYQDYAKGYAPFFLNTLMERIHQKKACNIVITGEPGVGKSYLAMDICRVLMGFTRNHKPRFKLSQVVFKYSDFMNLILHLKPGNPIVFDEPSYSMGKRDWYKSLNRALVLTMESFRYKRFPLFLPICNKSLLDKVIRSHLLTFQLVVKDRGLADVYRIHSSQFVDKVFHKWFCRLEYGMLDRDVCNRDSCLDCKKLLTCNLFRAAYERKKSLTQESRYEEAKGLAEKTEAKSLSMKQIENLAVTIKNKFVIDGKIEVQRLCVALEDEYGISVSNNRAYKLKAMLEVHHPELIAV